MRISTELQRRLHTGEEWGKNKCAIIAYAAGAEWKAQGCPARHPGRRRVEFIAAQTREQEFRRADETSECMTRWSFSGPRHEIGSITHEPLSFEHERDLGTLNVFLFQPMGGVQIRVMELISDKRVVAHTYPHNEAAQIAIYLIA